MSATGIEWKTKRMHYRKWRWARLKINESDPGRVARKGAVQFRSIRMLRNYGRRPGPRLPTPDRTKTKEDHRHVPAGQPAWTPAASSCTQRTARTAPHVPVRLSLPLARSLSSGQWPPAWLIKKCLRTGHYCMPALHYTVISGPHTSYSYQMMIYSQVPNLLHAGHMHACSVNVSAVWRAIMHIATGGARNQLGRQHLMISSVGDGV
jgi:hypothetical protein